jgi:sugar transferase (PEP-CTERM/EpsH1 system associated)
MNYLALLPRIVFPADTGAKIRNLNMFSRLSRNGDTATIVCYRSPEDTEQDVERMRGICTALELVPWDEAVTFSLRSYVAAAKNLISPYPYAVQKYLTPQYMHRIDQLLAAHTYDAIVVDTAQMSVLLKHRAHLPPTICFEHNVEYVVRQRQYEKATNPVLKAFFYHDYRRMRRFEQELGERCDHLIMVSDKDCETMHGLGVRNCSAVPLGVDTEFFSPDASHLAGASPVATGGQVRNLCFTGSMDWLPNDDGMQWFIRDILPRIRARHDVHLWIVGRSPGPELQSLVAGDPRITVTGRVPDVRPYIAAADVYVVPLRIGGGTRIKIFEAMAMGKPVVSTTTGAEGLPVTHDRDIVLVDEPGDFAASVCNLLDARERADMLGRAARTLVERNYSWLRAADIFADICARTIRDKVGDMRKSA